MAEHTPRDLMIAGIVFVFFIVSGISLITLYNAELGAVMDDDMLEDFKVFNRSSDLASANSSFTHSLDRLEEAANEDNPIFAAFGVAGALLEGAWATMSNLVDSFGFITTAIGNLDDVFGVPTFLIGILSMLVTTIILFMIYTLIFAKKV